MQMVLRCSLLTMTAAGFLAAQHGGGGHSGGGGGGHVSSGGGGESHAPAYHAPAPSHPSSSYSGGSSSFTTRVAPSYPAGQRSYSTPYTGPSGFTGINRNLYGTVIRPVGSGGTDIRRPVWGRPPIRGPIRFGYYGFGFYPVLGFGYYGNNWYDPSYYDSGASSPTYSADPYYPDYPAYDNAMPDQGIAPPPAPTYRYPPIPYDMPPQQEQQYSPNPESAPAQPPDTPVTLILRSGEKLQVQNYAIVNGYLWDFSKPNQRPIALSNIDAAASAKATQDAGGWFPTESFAANPN